MPEYVPVERSGPAIRAALAEASPDELRPSSGSRSLRPDDDFDLSRVTAVLDRWWGRAPIFA